MALAYTYEDKYLVNFCDEEMEARAILEVQTNADPRTLSAYWLGRLVVLQAYIFVCLDNMSIGQGGAQEDLFKLKLDEYRDELAEKTPRAYAAADAVAEVVSAPYSFPVVRA